MSELADMLIPDGEQSVRLVYGVATGTNTVQVRGSSVAVTLPAITSVQSGDYCAVLESGADRVIVGPVGGVTAWTDITFAGVWQNYGGGWQAGEYRKVGDIVYLRGLIRLSSGSVPILTNDTITTLPTGFRPPVQTICHARCSPSSGTNQQVDIRVSAAGVVYYYTEAGTTLNSTTPGWVTLDGVSFSVT